MVILVLGPSQAVIRLQLNNAMWALIKQMSKHLGAIMHEVKQIADNMKEVRDSRRAKVRLQVGVQTEEKEAGVEAEEEGEKGSEDGDKDGEGEQEMEE